MGEYKDIMDLAITYNPNMAASSTDYIRFWLQAGCDIDKDILPAMKMAMELARRRGQTIRSFKYFDGWVLKAHDRRLQEEALAKKPPTPAETIAARIGHYTWKRDKGRYLSPHEEHELAAWENAQKA